MSSPNCALPDLDAEQRSLLNALARLRVLTPFQAYWLVKGFHADNPATGKALTERNTRKRLQWLADNAFIRSARIRPERGAYSGIFYSLANRGLRATGREGDTNHLVRPQPLIRDYLLLRNELYARARAEGWNPISPLLYHRKADQQTVLERFHGYVRHQLEERSRHGDERAKEYLASLQCYLPQKLSFEYLLRVKEDGTDAIVLLVVDDPRRAIVREKRRTARPSPGKQPCPKCGFAHGAVPLSRARHPSLLGHPKLPGRGGAPGAATWPAGGLADAAARSARAAARCVQRIRRDGGHALPRQRAPARMVPAPGRTVWAGVCGGGGPVSGRVGPANHPTCPQEAPRAGAPPSTRGRRARRGGRSRLRTARPRFRAEPQRASTTSLGRGFVGPAPTRVPIRLRVSFGFAGQPADGLPGGRGEAAGEHRPSVSRGSVSLGALLLGEMATLVWCRTRRIP